MEETKYYQVMDDDPGENSTYEMRPNGTAWYCEQFKHDWDQARDNHKGDSKFGFYSGAGLKAGEWVFFQREGCLNKIEGPPPSYGQKNEAGCMCPVLHGQVVHSKKSCILTKG